MKKRKRRDAPPFPWLSNFNERRFNPFIRAIGQAALLWNDLHEWMGFLYGSAMCYGLSSGLMNPHFATWAALTNDRAKREVLLAAAKNCYVDLQPLPTEQQQNLFNSVKWLCDQSNSLEDDRNNIIHAPLWSSQSADNQVMPASFYGNQRATKLDNKYLLKEYERICDTARLLRNYATEIYRATDGRVPWPDKPKLPDRQGAKRPPPSLPKLYTKPSPQPKS